MRRVLLFCLLAVPVTLVAAAEPPRFLAQEIDPHVGNVCYAVTVADVDGNGRPDVVAVSEDAVYWYENPTWARHEVIRGTTERDNVCLQAHDIDGDGRVDFALGAGWRPPDTQKASTLQWLGRDRSGRWQIHPIRFDEPSMHRLRWGDVKGTGTAQLVVAPLQGRGTRGPNWGQGPGVRVLVYDVPDQPEVADWPFEVADDSLHTIHNLQLADLEGDGRAEVVLACWEGVFVLHRAKDGQWTRTRFGTGNQATSPFKGASEVKVGKGPSGDPYLATIEPWHGHQVVAYAKAKDSGAASLWDRRVIAEPVAWGHAVWCSNLDDDPEDELIIGQRDPNRDAAGGPRGPGVFVFDPKPGLNPPAFDRLVVDDGGMACEDALAADLDGDGRTDLVAGGRATHNVKIYWNRRP